MPGTDRQYNRNLVLLVVLVPLAMAMLQVSSVNVALTSISHSIGASASQLQWVLAGYALAIGLTLVPSGRLGDLFGRAEIFTLGLILFTVTSLACGLVNDPTALNIMRLAQGVAAGVYSPQVTGLIQQYFHGQARARAFAFFGFVVSVSVAAGPLLAGILITWLGHDLGWRSSFVINVPVGIFGIYAAFKWLPFTAVIARRNPTQATRRDPLDFDLVGVISLVATVLLIMLPFMIHGVSWVWWMLPGAAVTGVFWLWWENFYAKLGNHPMVDLNLFRLRSFSFNIGISALQFISMTSVFAITAIFVQDGLLLSTMVAATISLPNAISSAFASLWAGKHAIVRGRGLQVFAVAAMMLGVLGAAFCAWMIPHGWSVWAMAVPFTLQGIGQGAMTSVNQTLAMMDVPVAEGGVAGGVSQTVQRIMTAIGNAMMTGIFFSLVGDQKVATPNVWARAAAHAYGTIGLVMILCLTAAIVYWLSSRRGKAATCIDSPVR